MTDYWLIRVKNNTAYIWKRKYFLGLIAIPWAWHGGTTIIRTADTGVVLAAFDYIRTQSKSPVITVEL